jgi:hypothetical protein
MPGGLFEKMRDKDNSTIQKAVFGSPASADYKATGLDPNDEASGEQAKFGTGTPAVAGQGFYETPYGRISAKKGRVGDITTPTDLHRTSLIKGLENMGRTYNPEARYGSKENPIYRGAFEGSQKSEYNKNPDIMDVAERKRLGYTENDDVINYSYYGPLGEGPQNKVTNPTMTAANKLLVDQTDALRKKYPSIFQKGTTQNKAYVADFNEANPNYNQLDDYNKLSARTKYMSNMKDNPKYAELPLALPAGAPPNPPKDPEDPNRPR